MKNNILAVFISTVWIGFSEFFRNEFLLKQYWTDHYADMGITFPANPANGAAWGIWSLMLGTAILILSRKYTMWQTAVFSWFMAFAMMWVVIGNLSVLPFGILPLAVPLSQLETFVASWLIFKISPVQNQARG
ncbi:MAG: hypothetical protein JNL57_05125 [Bacteroidetes bacterium]|nr:hypothetical protein [Bacteroidota bacterium]